MIIPNDELFIESLYRLYLGRLPDPSGFDAYRARLVSGVARSQIAFEIRSSDECVERARRFPGIEANWPDNPFDLPPTIANGRSTTEAFSGDRNLNINASEDRGSLNYASDSSHLPNSIDERATASVNVGGEAAIHETVNCPPPQQSRTSGRCNSLVRDDGFAARRLLRGNANAFDWSTFPRGEQGSHVAFTIISNNYFALAKTLADSYLAMHPGYQFVIVIVDRADARIASTLESGALIAEIADLAVPGLSTMIYRYSIMELNTAVKPFVMNEIFQRTDARTVLYIDPDIYVFRPLDEVYSALETVSIALIPHLRAPYFDTATPSEVGILQSGTYNLGFLGLKRSKSSVALLEWWMMKLYADCIVDIPNGLFVDQKWIDLVPGFFPDHKIIYHPGYNAAYWNLHDRKLTDKDGDWLVDGLPLVFFHFSGFSPFAPLTLSKHQNRHETIGHEALSRLLAFYSDRLLANYHEYFSSLKYSFEVLPNFATIPLDLVRDFMQWAFRVKRPLPDPILNPDEFCELLMSKNVDPERPDAVAIFNVLLRLRGDVAQAFPNAVYSTDDPGFQHWLQNSGVREYKLADLMRIGQRAHVDRVDCVFSTLRRFNRNDVFTAYADMWTSPETFVGFVNWLVSDDGRSSGFGSFDASSLLGAVDGVTRILHLYFLRIDLQRSFSRLSNRETLLGFVSWLRSNRYHLDLSQEDISLFLEFSAARRDLIDEATLLYSVDSRSFGGFTSIYVVESLRQALRLNINTERALEFGLSQLGWTALDHGKGHLNNLSDCIEDFHQVSVPGLSIRRNFDFVTRLRSEFRNDNCSRLRINVAGYLLAPSGMGESARSLVSQIEQHNVDVSRVVLPHHLSQGKGFPKNGNLFGFGRPDSAISVVVANADVAAGVAQQLGEPFCGRRRIGYWVWETEEIPKRFAETSGLFHEIWTPSVYSSAAIARHVKGCEIRVVPHTVDFAAIDSAISDREAFGLPVAAVIFGYMFDPRSVIERKNVKGLLTAFGDAFRSDDNALLVIKANGLCQYNFEYEMLKASVSSDRIVFLEGTIGQERRFDFLKCIDVYVSLHRSEGFGLTCAEAMAAGIPVIATGYSGNLQFMNEQNSLLVGAEVIETNRPYGSYPAGTKWGDPNIEQASIFMRQLLNAEARMELGRHARESVRVVLSSTETLPFALLSASGQL